MFAGNVFLLPGQEIREFTVSRPNQRKNERGQLLIDGYNPMGTIQAILAKATSEERERWRQLEHPITHKIIMQHTSTFDIRPGDIFERDDRCFYNQAMPYNPGDLGHWTIFYCDERADSHVRTNQRG